MDLKFDIEQVGHLYWELNPIRDSKIICNFIVKDYWLDANYKGLEFIAATNKMFLYKFVNGKHKFKLLSSCL